MPRFLSLAAVQHPPLSIGADLTAFADDVRARAGANLVVYPELHLFGSDPDLPTDVRNARLRASAVGLDDPLLTQLGEIAAQTGVWLHPGSICERGPRGELFNTALLFAPDGKLAGTYRKIFPWRPHEPYDMGTTFSVVDLPGLGRVGLSICYDAWFPEVSRQLAWLGAEVVVNVVKTTTPDRAQELVLTRAGSIANQVFTVSVNCAGPEGLGRSLVVDPAGAVLAELGDEKAGAIEISLDLDEVARTRRNGTLGINRMWSQLRPEDPVVELPLYAGRLDARLWGAAPEYTETTQNAHPNDIADSEENLRA